MTDFGRELKHIYLGSKSFFILLRYLYEKYKYKPNNETSFAL